jgi:hypothetical protein
MKRIISTLTLIITLFLAYVGHAQDLKEKVFNDAQTIRLYVNDATESEAINRFTAFINKTSWTVQPSYKQNEDVLVEQGVDTLRTDTGSLFDFMMGEFKGQLEFYADRDSSNRIYIAVSGYASTSSWGGSEKSKMKKAGADTHWSQRAMFKQVNKHLSSYPNVNLKLYTSE